MCESSVWVFRSVSIFPDEASGSCSSPPSTDRENIFDVWGSAEGLSPEMSVPKFTTIQLANLVVRRQHTLSFTSLPQTRDEACNQKAVEEDICPSWYVRLFLRVWTHGDMQA